MSDTKSSSSTPLRINSPESYESAALEIEQEKQMVKALKRLSMGNYHDPDFPMEDPDLFLVSERDRNDDSTVSLDTLSLSKSTSPDSSDSHSPPLETADANSSRSKKTSSSHNLPQVAIDDLESSVSLSSHPVNHENLLWVPANLHPEVNPQQFKQHVKVTIDELLERKLSRSRSTRSKRSSLSLSTNDDSFNDDELDYKHDTSSQSNASRNRYSNPSLLELSNELETLSRLAGMDSDDAVTIARSLSTHSIGYTDVEKAAIDELGSPHVSAGANQAEILDFGMDKSSTRSFPGQIPGSGPMYRQTPQSPQRAPEMPSSPQQRYGPMEPQMPPESGPLFALKRSRRTNYRKAHTTQPTHLGSQLQNKKAGNLAELRHNLNSSMPMPYPNESDGRVKNSMSRLSMQSINPRSSQILFTYKGPKHGHSKPPASAPPNALPPSPLPGPRRALSSSMVQDSPYSPAISQDVQHMHRSHSAQNFMHQRRKGTLTSHQLRENLQQNLHNSSMIPQSGYPHTPHTTHAPNNAHRTTPRKVSPSSPSGLEYGHPQGARRKASPQQYSHPQFQNQVAADHQQNYQRQAYSSQPAPNQLAGQNNVVGRSRKHIQDANEGSRSKAPARFARELKFDKTSQLNENLNMLRNEINEFRESLSHPESKKKAAAKESENQKQDFRSATDDNSFSQPEEVMPEISFDISSTDVSYEDTLGMEKDMFEDIKTDASTSTPMQSPRKARKETIEASSPAEQFPEEDLSTEVKVSPKDTHAVSEAPFTDAQKESPTLGHDVQEISPTIELAGRSSEFTDNLQDIHDMKSDTEEDQAAEEVKESPKEEFREHDPQEQRLPSSLEYPTFSRKSHEKDEGNQLGRRKSFEKKSALALLDEHDYHDPEQAIDPLQRIQDEPPRKEAVERIESYSDKLKLVADKASPSMPVIEENKKLRKKKSFGSLNITDKKKNKIGWLWSKGRSVSAQNLSQEDLQQEPARSVSSPDIQTNKRHHKETKELKEPKENKISKFFKKKRSNSVSSQELPGLKTDASMGEDKEQKTIKRISSAIFKNSKEEESQHASDRKGKEYSLDEVQQELQRETAEEAHEKSSFLSKIKSKGKEAEDKADDNVAVETAEIDDTMDKSNEADAEEQKPQTTLEVQEKIKKLIKRTSKANQPLEYTDSAFGFPLPPPSVSTLIMLDYRFPVHVERAIYRLSHLKLANRKRSLREQVLLSNFMYAYLNLVDHTLHLEQRMSEEGSTVMEEPDADMDLFNDEDKDTDFESEDDSLDDNAFDNVRLDLRADPYNEITV